MIRVLICDLRIKENSFVGYWMLTS